MIRAFLACGLLLTAVPAWAAAPPVSAIARALTALQRDDAKLQDVGWRLATANARFCPDTIPAVGIVLADVSAFTNPGEVRIAARLTGDIATASVARGSPAALAGVQPGQEVLAIDGLAMTGLPPSPAGDYHRLTRLHDLLDAALATRGEVTLTLRAPDGAAPVVAQVKAVPVCRTRFELLTGGDGAKADGARVLLGRHFAIDDGLSEAEYAGAVAHELAHNILYHRRQLDAGGRSWGNVRRTEREADRLAVWLLANAGYDPAAMTGLMRTWGRRADQGIFRLPTHDGWDERVETIEAEIAALSAARGPGGSADWRPRFGLSQ